MSHVGRPDDGTDVTSFFNLEFNVPLADGSVAQGMTRERIQDELTEKFHKFLGGSTSASRN